MDMIPEIGFAAGEVYFCGIDKPVELTLLKKKVGRREDVLNMALGWLAREGNIELYEEKGRIYVRKINQG
jgi:hypothetical protein